MTASIKKYRKIKTGEIIEVLILPECFPHEKDKSAYCTKFDIEETKIKGEKNFFMHDILDCEGFNKKYEDINE